jgi:hypothetical protein
LQTLTFDISRSFVEDFGVEVERVREDAEVAEALRDAEALALRRDVQLVVGAVWQQERVAGGVEKVGQVLRPLDGVRPLDLDATLPELGQGLALG